jgi:hypothetical protein
MIGYKKQVENLLIENEHLRDDDQKLLANCYWLRFSDTLAYKLNEDEKNGVKKFLHELAEGNLPDGQSIRRCRRKLQEQNPHLRGRLWDQRHSKADTVKRDLRLF